MDAIPELDEKGLRRFGITTGMAIGAIFGLLLPWLFGFSYPLWPWPVGAILIIWALLSAGSMNRFYVGWMKAALLISKVTTPIVLGIAFFFVFFPVAIIFRLLGKDPMERQLDSDVDTYRHKSEPITPESMEKPF